MNILQEASGWIKFLGVLEIIGGILSLFFEFPIGVITGILSIISGVFLVSASNALSALNDSEAGQNLKNYFVLQGIVAAIGIAIVLLLAIGIAIV